MASSLGLAPCWDLCCCGGVDQMGWWVLLLVVAGLALGVYAEWRAERRRPSPPDDQSA